MTTLPPRGTGNASHRPVNARAGRSGGANPENGSEPLSTTRRYRKRPVVIEAIRFDGTESSGAAVIAWINQYAPEDADPAVWIDGASDPHLWLTIQTLEGDMIADAGDFVIRGIKGEFYPCKPDIFEATYEEVSDEC